MAICQKWRVTYFWPANLQYGFVFFKSWILNYFFWGYIRNIFEFISINIKRSALYTALKLSCNLLGYLRLQFTLVPARWLKTLTRDCILSNAFITFYICATTYMTHLTFISSPHYVYSLNLYGRTRDIYHWHISWDYTIIIFLSHSSHGLFFPILFGRSRSVASFVVKHLAQLLILIPKYFPF